MALPILELAHQQNGGVVPSNVNEVQPSLNVSSDLPPASWAYVEWGSAEILLMDVTVWFDPGTPGAGTVNNLIIAAAIPKVTNVTALPDTTVTSVDTGANTLAMAGHNYFTGDGPFNLVNSGGAPPGGFKEGVEYFVEKIDDNTIKLHTTFRSAMTQGTFKGEDGAVDITSAGSGTNELELITDRTNAMQWILTSFVEVGDIGAPQNRKGAFARLAMFPEAAAYALIRVSGSDTRTSAVTFRPVRTTSFPTFLA